MKMLSTAGALPTDEATLERMDGDRSRLLPREFAGAVNLLAHPLAGAAAFAAFGIGLASHAFGIWFGAMSSAAEMSERLFRTFDDEMAARTASFGEVRQSVEARAASAARALIADARSAARAADNDGGVPPAAGSEEAASGKASQREATRSATPDDLKAISGIGPKLEKVLNGLGVSRYGDIASWDAAEIARINAHLSFNGRIERDDWVGQARSLVESRRKD